MKNIVYAVMIGNNRKMKIVKVKLNESNVFTYDNKSYNISKDDFVIYKNKFVAFIFNENNTSPFDPTTGQITVNLPVDYTVAIRTNVFKQLLNYLNGNPINVAMILSIGSLLLTIAVGVIVFMTSKDIATAIENIKALIELQNGLGQ